MEFEVQRQDEAPGLLQVRINGDLDIETAPRLRRVLDEVLEEGCSRLVLTFNNACYIDSTGISLLLQTWSRLADQAGHMVVVCTAPRLRKVFQIVNLAEVIPVVDDEESARTALAALAGGTPASP